MVSKGGRYVDEICGIGIGVNGIMLSRCQGRN